MTDHPYPDLENLELDGMNIDEMDLDRMEIDLDEEEMHEAPSATPEFRRWLSELPTLTPAEIVEALRKLGYRGQDEAVRAVALAAHRHLRRIRAIHLEGVPRNELPDKANLMLVGPTGCGKTFLAELLFREVLTIPTTTVDITSFSESGYIGEDTNTLITRLLYSAGGDLMKTSVGMICLDEFDKLASSQNRAVFAGQGTTKDVSGFGVQRELLKLLEASTISVPTQFSHETYDDRPLISTADISFVAAGAFSGLKSVCDESRTMGIGFERTAENSDLGESRGDIAVSYQQSEMEDITNFQEYGFLPELVARFSRVVPFQPLPRGTLRQILDDNVIANYRREFGLAGCELEVDQAVMDKVVDQALTRQTGARGLRNAMTLHLENSAYDVFSTSGAKRIVMQMDGDEVISRIDTQTKKKRRVTTKKKSTRKVAGKKKAGARTKATGTTKRHA